MDLASVCVWQERQPTLLELTDSSDWLGGAEGAVTYLRSTSLPKENAHTGDAAARSSSDARNLPFMRCAFCILVSEDRVHEKVAGILVREQLIEAVARNHRGVRCADHDVLRHHRTPDHRR